MQAKGAIKLLAVLLGLACIYQLSFTFKTRSVEKAAREYAENCQVDEELQKNNPYYADSLRTRVEQAYLDSVKNQPVYNLLVRKYTYEECKEREINLGLDLRGGMNVMLEVNVEDVVTTLAGDGVKDPAFAKALEAARVQSDKSSDYIDAFVKAYERESSSALAPFFAGSGNDEISVTDSNNKVREYLHKQADAAVEAALKVLNKRIDNFGVTQPRIQALSNSYRILVELPGVKDPERVRKLLEATASLEFWPTYKENVASYLMQADAVLAEQLSLAEASVESVDEVSENADAAENVEVAEVVETTGESAVQNENHPLLSLLQLNPQGGVVAGWADASNVEVISKYLSEDFVKDLLPSDVKLLWSHKADDNNRMTLYAVQINNRDGKAPLDGTAIANARAVYGERGSDAKVTMSMTGTGTTEWSALTEQNVGNCVAIVLDDYVYSAPVVRQRIDGGNSEISGDFTIQEAQDLANVLVSGKVPVSLRTIQSEVVGPSLGQKSINAGLISFVIAFALVLLYMGIFYRSAGWLSDIALIFNVFLLMGILVSIHAVLTLPGIAGIVLTMGMAVDANVIIFERIKEELRGGKGIVLAVKDGFSNAYSAIIDGQLTTIITGIVLVAFGKGPVQGFATTLIIGIVTSLFCSIFITRLLIDRVVSKRGKLSFSRKFSENFLANVKFDFIGKRKISYILACILLVVTGVSLGVRRLNMGVDFTGGRVYVVRFDNNVSPEQVRSAINEQFAQAEGADASNVSCEVKQYGSENQMRIFTQYKYDDDSEKVSSETDSLIHLAVKGLYNKDMQLDAFRNTQLDQDGIVSSNKIGKAIASDMIVNACMAVLFAFIAIGLYIALRFRKWQWALGATLSLIQNAVIVIGVFSLFYGLLPFSLEIDQAFIAAILTIIGYSINDTVVIFDRIREFVGLYPKRDMRDNINNAIGSTLSRTINTSCTTLVVLLSIFFFGGETIRGFIFALTLGVVIGTYSSIFIATPIAFDMMKKNKEPKAGK